MRAFRAEDDDVIGQPAADRPTGQGKHAGAERDGGGAGAWQSSGMPPGAAGCGSCCATAKTAAACWHASSRPQRTGLSQRHPVPARLAAAETAA